MPRNESLRKLRIGRNWRQKDVADQLGTTIGRWERGYQQPSAYFRVKLCTLFGKSAQELGLVEALQSLFVEASCTALDETTAER
jgi:transcriptional regulator with XRE-family HTH domain